MGRKLFLAGVSLASIACAAASAQSSTETYTYDALGRLVRVVATGGPNDGETQSICYDPAGNRTEYASNSSAGGVGCSTPGTTPIPSPTPTPSPTPAPSPNQPPQANVDSMSIVQCGSGSVNVLSNDTDPESHYPLALVSIGEGSKGFASISGSSFIAYVSTGGVGTDTIAYVVRDSLGATSTGLLQLQITGEQSEVCF